MAGEERQTVKGAMERDEDRQADRMRVEWRPRGRQVIVGRRRDRQLKERVME